MVKAKRFGLLAVTALCAGGLVGCSSSSPSSVAAQAAECMEGALGSDWESFGSSQFRTDDGGVYVAVVGYAAGEGREAVVLCPDSESGVQIVQESPSGQNAGLLGAGLLACSQSAEPTEARWVVVDGVLWANAKGQTGQSRLCRLSGVSAVSAGVGGTVFTIADPVVSSGGLKQIMESGDDVAFLGACLAELAYSGPVMTSDVSSSDAGLEVGLKDAAGEHICTLSQGERSDLDLSLAVK